MQRPSLQQAVAWTSPTAFHHPRSIHATQAPRGGPLPGRTSVRGPAEPMAARDGSQHMSGRAPDLHDILQAFRASPAGGPHNRPPKGSWNGPARCLPWGHGEEALPGCSRAVGGSMPAGMLPLPHIVVPHQADVAGPLRSCRVMRSHPATACGCPLDWHGSFC